MTGRAERKGCLPLMECREVRSRGSVRLWMACPRMISPAWTSLSRLTLTLTLMRWMLLSGTIPIRVPPSPCSCLRCPGTNLEPGMSCSRGTPEQSEEAVLQFPARTDQQHQLLLLRGRPRCYRSSSTCAMLCGGHLSHLPLELLKAVAEPLEWEADVSGLHEWNTPAPIGCCRRTGYLATKSLLDRDPRHSDGGIEGLDTDR